ncbi:MAG: hypothetical protein FIA95_09755, partial [Gemmatimonadetes bacterium]|nr:hypothetical protein [Gemmatimonadota bacterium]
MVLHCNYEEIQALTAGGRALLDGGAPGFSSVMAPAGTRALVETLLPRLAEGVTVPSLTDARELQEAVDAIVDCLRVEMEAVVVATHAADEGAVAAYFDFAHALSVSHRLRGLVGEKEAL